MPSKSLYWHTFGSLTAALREAGVAEVFTPGAPLSNIVDFLRDRLGAHA